MLNDQPISFVQLEPMVLASPTSFTVKCRFWPGMSTAMSMVMAVNLCLSDPAVRFVLNDIFSGLRADDRQKLLHVSSPS